MTIRHCFQVVAERAVGQVKEEARIQAACGHHCFIANAVSRWQTKKTLYIGKFLFIFKAKKLQILRIFQAYVCQISEIYA